MSTYYFEAQDAEKYGVNEAILLSHLRYWVNHNKAHGHNFHEGRYWTYNTMDAFTKIFSFWSIDQVRRILKSLVDQKLIIKGSFSSNKLNRVMWYSLLKDISIVETIVDDSANGPVDNSAENPNAQCHAAKSPDGQLCGFPGDCDDNAMRRNRRMDLAESPDVITDIYNTDIKTNKTRDEKINKKYKNTKIMTKYEHEAPISPTKFWHELTQEKKPEPNTEQVNMYNEQIKMFAQSKNPSDYEILCAIRQKLNNAEMRMIR